MSVALQSQELAFREAVKAKPHWSITVRPTQFQEARIESLDRAWSLIHSCRVALRERDFPHFYEHKSEEENDSIGSWGHFEAQDGYWYMFRSGQFLERLTLYEDGLLRLPIVGDAARLAFQRVRIPQDFKTQGYVEFHEIVETVTEVYEFAARLAAQNVLEPSAFISIELTSVKDYILSSAALPQFFTWERFCPATAETITSTWEGPTSELLGSANKLAQASIAQIFAAFRLPAPAHRVAEFQEKFLKRVQ